MSTPTNSPRRQGPLFLRKLRREAKWLTPGIGIKRWLGLVVLGTTLLGVGLAYALLDVYRTAPETWWLPLLSAASLRFFPRWLRVLLFAGAGFFVTGLGLWGLGRSLLAPFLRADRPIVETLAAHRMREQGPSIVVIGGGHGLSTLLRGLKRYTHNITAVVTVADDGGSSGRLRESLGILPPGDIRNCLAALSNDEALLAQLFQYRFASGSGLEGHSFGNLFISALIALTGSFEEAIAESGRVLSVHGRVLPSTLRQVHLAAEVALPNQPASVRVVGESRIPEVPGRIQRVWLEPEHPPAFPKAVQAILAADMVVVGPGSLFTSLLPNLLVPDIAAALRATRAFRVFVCNVATQPGETDGFTCQDHLAALEAHAGEGLFDMIVVNKAFTGELPPATGWVTVNENEPLRIPVHYAPLNNPEEPGRHRPGVLAQTLIRLLKGRTGPLQ